MTSFHPQMAAAIAKFRALGASLAKPESLADARRIALEQRRWFNADPPALARVEQRVVPGPHRAIPVRLYVPEGVADPAPAIVYCHGGGWFACSNDTHDRILRLLAIAARAAVIGIDYCLAPENKFPKPVEEAEAVLRWVAANADDWQLDPNRLAFAGCSAGANLVLGAALSLPPTALARYRAGALFYGAYDPALSSDSCRRFGAKGEWLSAKEMAWCWKQYLARPEDRADPRAAPLNADDAALARLPPLYLCAAGMDPLRDDTVALAARLKSAGVHHALSVREGLGHSFLGFARMIDEARDVLQDASDLINAAWRSASAPSVPEQEKVRA
jgi:acetyl esterase